MRFLGAFYCVMLVSALEFSKPIMLVSLSNKRTWIRMKMLLQRTINCFCSFRFLRSIPGILAAKKPWETWSTTQAICMKLEVGLSSTNSTATSKVVNADHENFLRCVSFLKKVFRDPPGTGLGRKQVVIRWCVPVFCIFSRCTAWLAYSNCPTCI